MKPETATQQGWTVDALIAWRESQGKIDPRDSAAFGAMWMGIHRVKERREGKW
jgi:hypothetical protein